MNPILQTQNLTHTYPDGRPGLRGVSLTIAPGERVGLVGPNGAGKSTLFLRLVGVLSGRGGEVQIAGLDPSSSAARSELSRHVGVVFQNPDDQLFAPTLQDDVMFGPLNLGLPVKEADAAAAQALAAVGLAGFHDRSPEQLSGGEKRRAALAGVLAMRPTVLLLDEPTMFLDPRGRAELAELLRTLDHTLLIASHDLAFVRVVCDRAVVLDAGQLVADGPAHALLTDRDLLARHGLLGPE